ncbi:Hypothetical predicted protein [Cloeon dipterum]|uniref:Uncharacterized protein n=1 Tax=Cloeon dipterum TaxID=197152 RepID=A0A8S1C3H1_9INSE|nr:Hypothetical predicted protein [Cloeon dipterum]
MVCVPCFLIPILLFVWHKFIQPIVLMFWNPWKVEDKKNEPADAAELKGEPAIATASEKEEASACPFSGATSTNKSKDD